MFTINEKTLLNNILIFSDSEDENYSPSESDEDYTENEKILLDKVRNRKVQYSDSEV